MSATINRPLGVTGLGGRAAAPKPPAAVVPPARPEPWKGMFNDDFCAFVVAFEDGAFAFVLAAWGVVCATAPLRGCGSLLSQATYVAVVGMPRLMFVVNFRSSTR